MSEFTEFEVDVNLEETQAWDGDQAPLVDPGEYTLTVVGFEQKSGPKGPYIAVKFEVQDEGGFKGANVYNNYAYSNATGLKRLKQLAVACRAGLGKINSAEYMGATIRATVYHEVSQGSADADGNPLPAKTFANVKFETAIDEEPAAKTEPPPAAKAATKAATKPAANGAARRA